MDILERINELRNLRNWSVYKLAEESGITQSTLANMFSRKTQPSVGTLLQLCSGFGITISEFFKENCKDLSNQETKLINEFRKLSEQDKIKALEIIKVIKGI